jgi:YVTN family beta-propeller protein
MTLGVFVVAAELACAGGGGQEPSVKQGISSTTSTAPVPEETTVETAAVDAEIPVGSSPGAIVVGGGSVWVKNHLEETVSRIDPRTNKVVATIPLGRGQFGYLTYGAGALWATNNDANTVSRIDPGTNRVVATIRVGSNPQGIAVSADGVWVANHREASLSRIDTRTNRVVATIRLPSDPQAVAADQSAVWVGLAGAGEVIRLDPRTRKVTGRIPVGRRLWEARARRGRALGHERMRGRHHCTSDRSSRRESGGRDRCRRSRARHSPRIRLCLGRRTDYWNSCADRSKAERGR